MFRDYGAELAAAVGAVATGVGFSAVIVEKLERLRSQVREERLLREAEVREERLLREAEVALRKESEWRLEQLLEQERIARDDAVKARLFDAQNMQEYAGHPVNRHPAPGSG